MAARAFPFAAQPEVINLMSDDSDDMDSPPRRERAPLELDANGDLSPLDELPFHNFFDDAADGPEFAEPDTDHEFNGAGLEEEGPARGEFVRIDGEDVWIPDEEDEPAPPARTLEAIQNDAHLAAALADDPPIPFRAPESDHNADCELALSLNEEFNADTCLQRVLEIFPDISHEHIHKLYSAFDESSDYENLSGPARLDNIIEQLVSGTSYPKQEKSKQPARKRKREDSIDETDTKKWERQDRDTVPAFLKGSMQGMLKAEFPHIGIQHVNNILATEKHFYQAYLRLANISDGYDTTIRHLGRGKPSKKLATADTIALNCGWEPLAEELNAARKRVEFVRTQRVAEDAQKKAEEHNLQRAKERGETSECSCCFDDLPLNRQIHCDGPVAHFTCFDCAENYIKAEVGDSRCRVLCTAGCEAPFAPHQLSLLPDKQLLEKLAELEQEKAIRDAGLEDLEECPFCDYKAIVPPVDEDFEFRCANPQCEKISCRRCKSTTHIPHSCEQHAKNNKVNNRHKIEEAMTAAMIRSCNKCKKQFIKDYGCNKMACSSCGNLQCYVCSASVKDYNHFDQAPNRALNPGNPATAKMCPLYDNVEERHEKEIKEAEAAARAQVMQDNPDVQPEDLDFKLSDAVKKATHDRIKKAGGVGGDGVGFAGFGAGIGGIGGMGFPAGYPGNMAAAARAMFGVGGGVVLGGGADDEDGDEDFDGEDDLGLMVEAHHARQVAQQAALVRLQRDRMVIAHQRVRDAAQARHQVQRQVQAADAAMRAADARAQEPAPQPQGFIPVYGMPQPNGPARRPAGLAARLNRVGGRVDAVLDLDHLQQPVLQEGLFDFGGAGHAVQAPRDHRLARPANRRPAVGAAAGGLNIEHDLAQRLPHGDFGQLEALRERQRQQQRQHTAWQVQQQHAQQRLAELRTRQDALARQGR
ncbi:hypothetical protein LTR17_022618 [Elasticomyces elasticus]|nr:hypothetical protein LTR17_022618 [Elasticomyces elasticus]